MQRDVMEHHEPGISTLDASVMVRLRSVASRLRGYVLIEGITRVVGFLVMAAGVQLLIDFGTRGLRWSMRAAILGLIVLTSLWLFRRLVVTPLRHRFSLAEVANLIERRYPELSSLLISAVRFAAGEVGPPETNSVALVNSVIARAGVEARTIDFTTVLNPRRARWAAMVLAAAIAVCVGATAAAPEMTALWFGRNVLLQNIEWPKHTHLIVELDGDELVGARGDDLAVHARAEGVQPRAVEIVWETVSGKRARETMVTVGSEGSYRYRYTFKNAQEDFVFHLEGGDDRTPDVQAHLLERPQVTHSELRIEPPVYSRLDAMTLGNGRQRAARILVGSHVTIRIETNKPVARATLMAGREIVAEAVRDGEHLAVTLTPHETHTYHFALLDEVGLENRRPVRFSLRVITDEPPRAHLKLSGVGNMITPDAVLPIEVEFYDTYGLATAELIIQLLREDTDEISIPLPTFKPHVTRFVATLDWPVVMEGLIPGDTLTLMARATDFDNVSGPNLAQSPEATLRVVTRDELLAELARREQEYRADLERLIDSQEQLRSGLLTVVGRFQRASSVDTLAVDLAPLERRQRNITGAVNVIHQQFERILGELRVNQLDTLDECERLGNGIIEPLTRLAKRDLVAAADMIRQWSRKGSAQKASLIDPQQVAILSQMRTVLACMIQWEGYQEVVKMLRDIIRLQRNLHTETRSTIEDQAGEVFDD